MSESFLLPEYHPRRPRRVGGFLVRLCLKIAKLLRADYWFATRILGWRIDEGDRTGSTLDHFHKPDGWPVYRYDY